MYIIYFVKKSIAATECTAMLQKSENLTIRIPYCSLGANGKVQVRVYYIKDLQELVFASAHVQGVFMRCHRIERGK